MKVCHVAICFLQNRIRFPMYAGVYIFQGKETDHGLLLLYCNLVILFPLALFEIVDGSPMASLT